MCTAVVGGSIQRAATRISTASDQRNATPMRNHRTKDRSEPFRGGVLVCVSGFSLTLQNNRFGWIHIVSDMVSYRNLAFGASGSGHIPRRPLPAQPKSADGRMAAEADGLQTRPLNRNHKTCSTQAGLLMEGLGI